MPDMALRLLNISNLKHFSKLSIAFIVYDSDNVGGGRFKLLRHVLKNNSIQQ